MTKKENQTQENTFVQSVCLEMMNKMMNQKFEDCDCADVMSQYVNKSNSSNLKEMLSQFEKCCGFEVEQKPAP